MKKPQSLYQKIWVVYFVEEVRDIILISGTKKEFQHVVLSDRSECLKRNKET
jgi:hypothetical protein